jgi:hypothetical protein
VTTLLARDKLIEDMATARARVMDAISGLDEAQASRPEIDGWSVKDQLAHLTVCDEIRFHEINRISRGGRPGYVNLSGDHSDTFNEIVVSLRRTLPLDQVIEDLGAARTLVLQAIAAAPDAALDPSLYGDNGYPVNGSIDHDNEHATTISAWRKRAGL